MSFPLFLLSQPLLYSSPRIGLPLIPLEPATLREEVPRRVTTLTYTAASHLPASPHDSTLMPAAPLEIDHAQDMTDD